MASHGIVVEPEEKRVLRLCGFTSRLPITKRKEKKKEKKKEKVARKPRKIIS